MEKSSAGGDVYFDSRVIKLNCKVKYYDDITCTKKVFIGELMVLVVFFY